MAARFIPLDDALKGPVARTDGTKSTWAKATFPVRVADYTLTAWVNQSSDTVYDHIGKIGTSNGGARFFLGTDTLIFTMSINNAGAVIGSNTFHPVRAAKDSWSHMAMRVRHVWNEDTLSYSRIHTFFMNGVATTGMVTEAATPTWAGANANLYMFNMSTTSALDRPYEGRASDVRLYARALGDAEIAEIARGPAAVSAGGDFSTPDAVAVLRGTVAPHGSDWFVDGFAGTVRWEHHQPPAGAAAEIATPESAVTRVTLPAEGTYRFRLTATADRFTNAAEVAVTRLAAMAAAPSVSLPASASVARPLRLHLEGTASGAERVFWRKASGPGGVWFEPSDATATDVTFSGAGTYVLRLTAENGGASASADVTVAVTDSEGTVALDDGLKFHWPMDIGNLAMERITGMSDAIRPDYTNSVFTKGARLHGVASVSDVGYATTRCRMTDFERSADGSVGNSAFVTNEWAAVAMWIYRDSRLTYETRAPFLFSAHQTLGLRFGRWDNYGDGFTLQQQGSQGSTGSLSFGAPTRSMVDRWTHVYALYSRADGAAAKFALYIDGVKQTPASSSGFPRPARMPVVDIEIGGIKPGRQVGPAMGNVARPEGGYYSASFPGTIDDVRVYGRPLTEAEIRTLASRPNLSENLPPVFSVDAPMTLRPVARRTFALPMAAFDDGLPAGGALNCEWRVVSENASNVTFTDATVPSTDVRFAKSGTYTLQLVAADGERTSYSPPVTVDVQPLGTTVSFR